MQRGTLGPPACWLVKGTHSSVPSYIVFRVSEQRSPAFLAHLLCMGRVICCPLAVGHLLNIFWHYVKAKDGMRCDCHALRCAACVCGRAPTRAGNSRGGPHSRSASLLPPLLAAAAGRRPGLGAWGDSGTPGAAPCCCSPCCCCSCAHGPLTPAHEAVRGWLCVLAQFAADAVC